MQRLLLVRTVAEWPFLASCSADTGVKAVLQGRPNMAHCDESPCSGYRPFQTFANFIPTKLIRMVLSALRQEMREVDPLRWDIVKKPLAIP